MKLDIITPESGIFSGEVTAVSLPGKDGIFQVLNNHAPIISALAEGVLSIELESPVSEEQKNEAIEIESPEKISVKIRGGVAELTNNSYLLDI